MRAWFRVLDCDHIYIYIVMHFENNLVLRLGPIEEASIADVIFMNLKVVCFSVLAFGIDIDQCFTHRISLSQFDLIVKNIVMTIFSITLDAFNLKNSNHFHNQF